MNSLVLLLFLIGVILVTIGYTKSNNNCPLPKIQYKFIPRSLYEEQFSPNNTSSKFKNMFNESSPWYNYHQGNLNFENETNNYDNFFKLID